MPNFISNGNEWYPCSDDPVLFSQQIGALKNVINTATVASLQATLNVIDSKTSSKFLPASNYKKKSDTGA